MDKTTKSFLFFHYYPDNTPKRGVNNHFQAYRSDTVRYKPSLLISNEY